MGLSTPGQVLSIGRDGTAVVDVRGTAQRVRLTLSSMSSTRRHFSRWRT